MVKSETSHRRIIYDERAIAEQSRDMTFKSIANDNEMTDLQRIRALEVAVAKTRKDLARVDKMLRLTPTKPRLKKQKGAIEKIIFLAQVEIAKLRKRARPPKAPTC